ncbi:hypothetical protein TWF106_009988 [Orbilia oligospora]|uniref:Uncharacterized protein n=1 Tax=Orbilia oligospora TaxID=2813651 RepID=A0A7C8QGG2_ORBOL|nr:hypothetical protein TWF106_009988 [Orbilia oligospora]
MCRSNMLREENAPIAYSAACRVRNHAGKPETKGPNELPTSPPSQLTLMHEPMKLKTMAVRAVSHGYVCIEEVKFLDSARPMDNEMKTRMSSSDPQASKLS